MAATERPKRGPLRMLFEDLSRTLDKVLRFVGDNYKVTLVARYVGEDLDDADIIIGNDDLDDVEATLQKMKDRPVNFG